MHQPGLIPRLEVHTIQLADGVRYELPVRPLGAARYLGLVPIGFGLLFVAGPLGAMIAAIGDLTDPTDPNRFFSLLPLLFLAAFVAAGSVPIAIGLMPIVGRSAVEIRGNRIRAIERIGPLRWSRRRQVEGIRKLEVVSGPGASSGSGLASLAGLKAISAGQKNLMVAWGYPKDLLLDLADDLADHCQADRPARLFDQDEQTIEIAQRTVELPTAAALALTGQAAPDDDPLLEPPPDTPILVDRRDDGLTLTVPPRGIRAGSKGILGFAIAWNGFMALFTGLWIAAATGLIEAKSNVDGPTDSLMVAGILLLFWAIGIATALIAVNNGRRQAMIDVVGDTLLLTRRSLYGTKQQEWSADQLTHICLGPSGWKVNNRSINQLQIHTRDSGTIGLLNQVSDDEIRWIASELRHALGLPARS